MYRDLIVVSPCICRKDIHNETFPILIKMISRDPHVLEKTTFLINIDPPSGLNNETQDETEQNFIDMFKQHNVQRFEITKGEKGCFFTASKRLLQRANELIDANSFSTLLWFEDDKKLHKDPIFEGYMKDTEDYVIHLWKRAPGCPSFHPCLWSASIAKKYLIPSIINQTTPYDPELLMMRFWRKNFKGECRLIHYFFSTDVGREWQHQNNIKKWVRENTLNKDVTYV